MMVEEGDAASDDAGRGVMLGVMGGGILEAGGGGGDIRGVEMKGVSCLMRRCRWRRRLGCNMPSCLGNKTCRSVIRYRHNVTWQGFHRTT